MTARRGGVGEPCCTVLLGLMQKNRRRRKRIGQGMLSIGYTVYKVPGAGSPIPTLDVFGWTVLAGNRGASLLSLEWSSSSTLFAPVNASPSGFPGT